MRRTCDPAEVVTDRSHAGQGVVVHVAIDGEAEDDRVTGTLLVEGGREPVPFHGWVELMALITEARRGRLP